MSILNISNIINVSITNTPTGLTTPNVNSVALFTNETPNNINPYGIYISSSQVASDFGSNSVTAAMAENVFAQSPNILAGDGQLVIIPLVAAVSATSGHVVTANISANLASLIAVTNGDLKVTLGTTVYNLGNLNFTGCVTMADIATVFQTALATVATVTATTTAITFTNNKVGTASSVALAAFSSSGTDLSGAGYLNTTSATTTAGVNSSGEALATAISRTQGQVFYCGVMTNINLEDTAISTAAAYIQSQDMLFFHHLASSADIAGIGTTIQQASDTKTRLLLYTPGEAAANLMKAAYVGRFFSVDFTGSNTSITMNLKQLANVTPDLGITQTMYVNTNIAGVNVYVSYQGVPGVYSTEGNDYDDNEYANLALKFAMETAGFNYLAGTQTKVPQTEDGMNGLKSAYAQVCKQFVLNGCMAPGSWTSSETFGNQLLFLQNVLSYGYYIYSLPIVQQNQSDRAARKAPLVQIAIKRAGAIQTSNLQILVNS